MTQNVGAAAPTGGAFDALLADLLKAQEQNKGPITAAAPAAAGAAPSGASTAAGAVPVPDDGDDEELFGKAMTVVIDGEEREAFDARTPMRKLHATSKDLRKSLDAHADELKAAHAFGTKAVELIAEQGAMIKAMQDQLGRLANSGTGRVSTLMVGERPAVSGGGGSAAGGAAQEKIGPADLLVKAEGAMAAGRITGMELATLEATMNRRQQPDAELVARIVGPAK